MSGERNFHIFYQLCLSDKASKYGLQDPSKHHYTNQSDLSAAGIDDKKEFAEVIEAFNTLNFAQKDKDRFNQK